MTLLAMLLAAVFLGLAVASIVMPGAARQASWLPLHLLLAGAASTAIAGVMPFFSAAVSGAPPAQRVIRLAAVFGVAAGAAVLVAGRGFWPSAVGISGSVVAGVGGVLYLAGVLATAAATLLPLRYAVGPRRVFMGAIYGVALANVLAGVALSTLFLFDWRPVVEAWGVLRPAHAWLNLFGFVSLVIAGSLLHLLPTVAGARIRRTKASMVCFAALAAGPAAVALGFAAGADVLAVAGASATVVGALALGWHAVAVLRSRASWTTDPGWHRFTTWSLVLGIVWFTIGASLAALPLIGGGASLAAWDLAPLVVPLGIGWAAQVLVGAWSHLVPAVGPGGPTEHARQRQILGLGASLRLLLTNAGAVALLLAGLFDLSALYVPAVLAVMASGTTAVVLLGVALTTLIRTPALPARRHPSEA